MVSYPPANSQLLQTAPAWVALGVRGNKRKKLFFRLGVEGPDNIVACHTMSLELCPLREWKAPYKIVVVLHRQEEAKATVIQ